MSKPTDRSIFQNAWVVPDVEAAAMRWVREMGVGPFFVIEYPGTFRSLTYRGEPAELKMTVALAQAGPTQIELIQPHVESCVYHDSVPVGQSGFHHVCVWTHDMVADTAYFEGLGYDLVCHGQTSRSEFGYFDTRPLMGCMLEVVGYNEAVVERFAEIARAAEGWNGKEPLRS